MFESDVDCGMTCAGCAAGKHCFGSGDCATNLCVGGACQSCTTPADCPAPPNACVLATCSQGTCGTAFVAAGPLLVSCQQQLRCDGAGNITATLNAEWGVSCGPSGFPSDGICDGGALHGSFSTCISPPPQFCTDGVKDGLETDVDCGGATSCARCRDGQACTTTSDCAQEFSVFPSPFCSSGVCQAPSCHNGAYDPSIESDVDCGVTCGPCASGRRCYANADCQSHACAGGICM
jgi:hypothetical protein